MPDFKKVGLTVIALLGIAAFENSVDAQDVNRRSVKNFSQYRAEEQARMYDWYGHGRPQLIEPAAGPATIATVTPTRRGARLDRWNDDIGIKRYVPPLGSAERPFIIRVEPEGAPMPPMSLSPIR